jgi:hypothetical protein
MSSTIWDSAWISSVVSNQHPSASVPFLEIGGSHMVPNQGRRWVGDGSHLVFLQILLSEDGSVRQGVVMVKQPDLFSPKFGATSSHVFTQTSQ